MPAPRPTEFRLRISPNGRLAYEPATGSEASPDAPLPADVAAGIAGAFSEGQTAGLLHDIAVAFQFK